MGRNKRGGYLTSDLRAYFAAAQLPVPRVFSQSVDGAKNASGEDADSIVTMKIEVAGVVAPGAPASGLCLRRTRPPEWRMQWIRPQMMVCIDPPFW